MKLRRIVAQNLRRLRQDRGLTQEELADLAGLNRNYIGIEKESKYCELSRRRWASLKQQLSLL